MHFVIGLLPCVVVAWENSTFQTQQISVVEVWSFIRSVLYPNFRYRVQLQAFRVPQKLLRVLRSQDPLLCKLSVHRLQKRPREAWKQELDAACRRSRHTHTAAASGHFALHRAAGNHLLQAPAKDRGWQQVRVVLSLLSHNSFVSNWSPRLPFSFINKEVARATCLCLLEEASHASMVSTIVVCSNL